MSDTEQQEEPPPPDDKVGGPAHFGARVRVAGLVIIQLLIGLVIFAQVNYIGSRQYQRYDLTHSRRFTLSEQSLKVLGGLQAEADLIMVFLRNADLYVDVDALLSEYEHRGEGRIRVERLDLSRDFDRLAALKDELGIPFDRNLVLVRSGDRLKAIGAEDLVTRGPEGGVLEFRGEETLTSALLEVSEDRARKVYLVTGLRQVEEMIGIGEQLGKLLGTQNIRAQSFSFASGDPIPDDAEAIFITGPTSDLSEIALERLDQYWEEQRGSLFLLLDPAASTPNLRSFTRQRGIAPNDDRVLSVSTVAGVAPRKVYQVPAAFLPGHELTRALSGINTRFTGQTQSLGVFQNDELLMADGILPTPLAIADARFWGETDYREEEVALDENQDHLPPVYLAAACEKAHLLPDGRTDPNTSRLVVVGNPDLLDPAGNTAQPQADFLLAATNWLVDRSEMIGIPPRRPTAYTLDITPAQFGLLQTLATFALPAAILFLGGLIWFVRRH